MNMAFLPVFILLLLISSCKTDNQLTPAKPLSPGDMLISENGVFALGFFSPTNTTTRLYVGIWYHNIPERTTVWVANRDNPITTRSSGKLLVTNSSDLVLQDSKEHIFWATKNNITTGGTRAAAVLLNNGNLVLRLPNSTDIWQSFDYPTDTILPGMRFSMGYQAHVAWRLVAWKGLDDPSTGDFSFSGDPSSNLQGLIWQGARPHYRTAVWNGAVAYGMYESSTGRSVFYQTAIYTGDEFYVMYTTSDGSPGMRLMLDYTGMLRFLSWNSNSSSWTVFFERPVGCDLYAACGPFGYCDFTGTVLMCQCLDGFEPNGLDSLRGCRRREALNCSREDRFVTLPGMKVPDKFSHVRNRSFAQCAAECSGNCSCTAYAYTNLSTAGTRGDQSRCLVWMGELIDTAKIGDRGENLYLRLRSTVQKKSGAVKIVLPIIACLLILAFIALVWICKYRGNQRKKEIRKRLMLAYLSGTNELGGENIEFPFISFEDVIVATDSFSDSNMLGKGGFGKVYKGMLEGGKEVAIKRLSKGSGQGTEEFRNEVTVIAKLQHRNLVRLLGCCIHEDEKLLIYEYLPNKSLDAFLFDVTRKSLLDWPTRTKIIKGVARGLLYLHQDSRLTIIHRDLKASNILLDAEMSPKISDFGMARIFGGGQQEANTTRVVGTYGYMSPEYAMEGAFSVKSDTYSFGVLLLEIVSGMKINSPHLRVDFPNLVAYAWGLWKDGNAGKLVDPSFVESCPFHEASRCIHIGLLCVQDHPNDRPFMSSVVFMLENESTLLPAPKEPVYFALRNYENEETRENTENSVNTMSTTTLEGR